MSFMNTDAVKLVACSHCKQPAGADCVTPKGKKLFAPHSRRLWDLQHMPGFTLAKYQIVQPPEHNGDNRTPRRGPGYE